MAYRRKLLGLSFLSLFATGCASAPATLTPPPRACGLAEFAEAPGMTLPRPPPLPKPPQNAKSAPLQQAVPLEVNTTATSAAGWSQAAPGWQAWRFWVRSEARSMSVHVQPFDIPPGAELWICAPDGTLRQGPFTGKGPGAAGEVWSGTAQGPEIWLELLVPQADKDKVTLRVDKAFAGPR